ncbi:hypothetical protein BABINDRAFT_20651, partial [Babjeviella inositovora NRRL Y-12698]
DSLSQINRKQVLENTMLNAQLFSENSKGQEIREKLKQKKLELQQTGAKKSCAGDENLLLGEATETDELKWDEANLYLNEQNKSATMKIDEPKTPYTGGVDPNGEYYQEDDDEEDTKTAALGIPSFSLGESEFHEDDEVNRQSINGGSIIPGEQEAEEEEEEEEDEPQLSAEEKHRRFEEMRKKHYHLKGEALHKILVEVDDE